MKYCVVGEAWTTLGKRLNQPFTGNADTLLKAVLSGAGIPLEEVYFTNAVNLVVDKVTKGHVDKCQDALFEEIRAQAPKVVLACGSWAAYALLGKQVPITEMRGYPFWSIELQTYVVPTLHPGAVTYNPKFFEDFAHDVDKLKSVAKLEPGGMKHEEPNLVVVETYEQAMELFPKMCHPDDNVMSVDIETDGFDYFKDDILSIGIGTTDKDVYIFNKACIEDPQMRGPLEKLLGDPNITYVYQNGKFDVQYMRANPNPKYFSKGKKCIVSTARCDFDTMLAHYCIDERQGTHGLKLWAREEFDAPDWEADLGKYLPTKATPYSAIPPEVLHKYQAYDVFYTRKGYYRFTEKMKEEGTYDCFQKVYVPAVEAFTQIELEGIPIDRARLQELYDEAQPRIAEAKAALIQAAIDVGWSPTEYAKMKNAEKMLKWQKENAHLPEEKQARKPGGTEIPKEFNPASHPQLSWVAYDLCNMPLFEGKKTCNKDAVDLYRHRHPFWEALANYKEVSDLFGTFIKGMLERTDPDDRIRPDFLLHGTKTGRISCSNPNMQNLPRGSVVKDFFVADPGCVVVNADYKTLEVVIAAILSNDPAMKKPFIEHLDFHSETTKKVYAKELEAMKAAVAAKDRKPFDEILEMTMMMEIRHKVHELLDEGDFEGAYNATWKHMRFLTKFITFGVMYGRGPESLAKGELNCSILQAQGYMDQFFSGYPKYKKWLDTQFKHAKETGYVQNVFGFKRRWPFITQDTLHEVKNQSWNTPVQGSASMVCMQALCRIQKELTARGWGRVLFTVHDSIVTSLSKEHLQEAMTLVHDEMVKDVIGTDVQLEAELEVGPTYKKVDSCILKDGKWIAEDETNEWLIEVLANG